MIVFISGNIGAGKSTIIDSFKASNATDKWMFLTEPATEWTTSGLLGAMYDGSLTPGEFQLMALVTRVTSLLQFVDTPLIMAERSPWEDAHVFATNTLSGIHQVNYDYVHDRLMKLWDPSPAEVVHIILEVDPDVALSRIATRARSGEGGITAEYLCTLNNAYRTFSPPGVVHRIDANGTEAATMAAISHTCRNLM
jgi:deoxyadenosine/deoxycytidine kinase